MPKQLHTFFQCLTLVALSVIASPAISHELRPAFLEITEVKDSNFQYDVLWKLPRSTVTNELLALQLNLPNECEQIREPINQLVRTGKVSKWRIDCNNLNLMGSEISVNGLAEANSKVLIRIELLDQENNLTQESVILTPSEPSYTVVGEVPKLRVAWDYIVLGVEHILLGIDHLLFVLALLLIINGLGPLIKAITSFTIAHSITLAMATLGFVNMPAPPVEAVIALSILFLAVELIKQDDARVGLTQKSPWLVAFSFGLLHGFGFAGALSEVGLPDSEIPLALLTFNVGVELGQLIFVVVSIAVIKLLHRVPFEWPKWSMQLPAYLIGTMAMFWCVERISGFWS